MRKGLDRVLKIVITVLLSIFMLAVIFVSVLEIGLYAEHVTFDVWRPDYAKVDISNILKKDELTDEDYDLLYAQTGLTKLGIDGTISSLGKSRALSRIVSIQQRYMSGSIGYEEVNFYAFGTRIKYGCKEVQERPTPLCALEPGDILVSSSTHFSLARFGHSALVVDSSGSLLEAIGYGDLSYANGTATNFSRRQTFAVLRVKRDGEVRKSVADYAKGNLVGIEYAILAGLSTPKNPDELKKTSCGHIVWYAYNHFGIDIDSNGGAIAYPKDFLYSNELELVQVFGFDPKTLEW